MNGFKYYSTKHTLLYLLIFSEFGNDVLSVVSSFLKVPQTRTVDLLDLVVRRKLNHEET